MAEADMASAPAEAAQAAVPAVIPDYQRGDLVWAKIKGFPWWPSQIRSVRNLRQRSEDHVPYVRVRFLHTKDNAEVAPDKLLPYTEANAELGIVKPKMFKSDGLKKKFLTAVAQADAWPPPPPAEPEEWSDDEVVEQEEVEAARAEASAHRAAWRSEGHELLGQHVARFFGASQGPKVRAYLAVITRWSPWEDTNLFHVLHDDGDEEDLEEEEVRKAISAYRRQLLHALCMQVLTTAPSFSHRSARRSRRTVGSPRRAVASTSSMWRRRRSNGKLRSAHASRASLAVPSPHSAKQCAPRCLQLIRPRQPPNSRDLSWRHGAKQTHARTPSTRPPLRPIGNVTLRSARPLGSRPMARATVGRMGRSRRCPRSVSSASDVRWRSG
jgi:hypothetical protein